MPTESLGLEAGHLCTLGSIVRMLWLVGWWMGLGVPTPHTCRILGSTSPEGCIPMSLDFILLAGIYQCGTRKES